MGKCSYYLMKAEGLTVEAENVACSGAISENMNFLPSFTTEMPSCTKSLTIKFHDAAGQLRTIKLKQGGFVLLDGLEVPKLPRELSNGAVKIRQASSSFVIGATSSLLLPLQTLIFLVIFCSWFQRWSDDLVGRHYQSIHWCASILSWKDSRALRNV